MKQVGEIYETNDYGMFKRLEGNRAVTAQRAKKIRNSIEKNGYIFSPIAVNENMEIIDGQGRYEALFQLSLPVQYYIVKGAGREECIALNIYGTPWTIKDYINSYVEYGIEDYKRLSTLIEEHKKIPFGVVVFAVTGKESQDKAIKNGLFRCTGEEFLMADRVLVQCERARKVISTIPGAPQCVYRALIFALTKCEEMDEDRMFSCLEKRAGAIPRIGTMQEALEMLETTYNYRLKSERIYLVTDYDKYQRSKYPWYGNKYGSGINEDGGEEQ